MSHQITSVDYQYIDHEHVFDIVIDGDFEMLCTIDGYISHCSDIPDDIDYDNVCDVVSSFLEHAGPYFATRGYTGPTFYVDILNEGYSVDERFLMVNHSGEMSELPAKVLETLSYARAQELKAGDWITMIDDDIVEIGEFLPHYIKYERTT